MPANGRDKEILNELSQILRDLLDDQSIVLTMETTRGDVPDWDSLVYVNFIVSAEMAFGVQFRVADVEAFEAVGDIVAEIRHLLGET